MTFEDFKNIVDTIPHLPGVYRFLDPDGTIIYVGKAKDLRNRLTNYFGDKKQIAYKTKVLTKNAQNLEFTLVESEHDALLLENTLIKQFQPRYNVSLKDGKTYTYLVVKNERFPRVFFTRKVIRDGSQYFGPYTSKFRMKQLFEVIKKLFPLRTCTLNLSEENINKGKFKVCLEYHIKNCMGPCEKLETESEYQHKIDQVVNILKGNFGQVKVYLKSEMERYTEKLAFEQAQLVYEKLQYLDDYQSRSTVINTTIKDVDVFSIREDEKSAYVNYLKVINGALINTDTFEFEKNLDEDLEDILGYAIPFIREKFNSIAPEIIIPFKLPLMDTLQVTVPQRGEKMKILELSIKNLDYFLSQKQRQEMNKTQKQTPAERILNTLKSDLHMKEIPFHIECFDNSNIQGTNPVSSCVVFKNAKPSKKDYRHFNVKTVEGPNDFASMEEVVYRRYKRLIEEKEPLPQLIIIDGGKGQLSAAAKILENLGILSEVTVIGIAKRLEEIFFPGDSIPLYINKKSESLKLIQHCRNEAHRFAINFHRDKRSGTFLKSELDDIPGIGKKTGEKLLKEFGSILNIRKQTEDQIKKVVGEKLGGVVYSYFKNKEM